MHLQPSTNRQRVAIVGRLDTRGGVQSCILALIRGLNQRGITPDILWVDSPNRALLDELNLRAGYYRLPMAISWKRLDRMPDFLSYLAQLLNTFHAERIAEPYDFYYIFYNGFLVPPGTPHLRYLSGPPLLPQLFATRPGWRGVPARTGHWLYQHLLYRFFPAYEVHRGDHYVINSQYTARLFEEAHGLRLPVVNPPIDVSSRSFEPGDLAQRDTITFFSRVAGYKRPEMVIDLAARFPHLRCVIMGSVPEQRAAYMESLKERARARGREDIVFLITPDNERVRQELARTRFFVFPALNEHFGMATPEAIASGAVPFVHDSGGQREIVPDERLRFSDAEFFSKFEALLRCSDAELNAARERLREHIQQYRQEVFVEKMLAPLGDTPGKEAAE